MSCHLGLATSCSAAADLSPKPSAVAPRSIARNVLWSFSGNVLLAACQWAVVVVLARLGTPHTVGVFALALAVTTPVILLASLSLRTYQVTDSSGDYSFSEYMGLRLIAAAFGLKHEDPSKAVLLKRLEEYLLNVYKQGRRALLVIDEAQNLTPRAVEELRMLSNFQSGEKSLLQSFLLGQPEFRYTLQGEGMQQLRQRIIASYHLGPMDSDETRSYIEHRMKTVGWAGDPEFGEDCFAPIFQYTGGIPRRINTLCDRVLLFGYLEDRHRIDAETVHAVIGDLNGEMPTLAANEASGPRAAARKAASGDDRMLEQIASDPRHGGDDRNAVPRELVSRADATAHQDGRAVDRAAGDDDLAAAHDLRRPALLLDFRADRAGAFEQDALHDRLGHRLGHLRIDQPRQRHSGGQGRIAEQ